MRFLYNHEPSRDTFSRRCIVSFKSVSNDLLGAISAGWTAFLSNLCQITQFNAAVSIYGFTPIFKSLDTASTALLVCSVDMTRCPVIAAFTANSALASDLISPTMMMSGSCLRTPFSHSSNVYPAASFICDCVIPWISYSTGSSRVIIFLSSLFS